MRCAERNSMPAVVRWRARSGLFWSKNGVVTGVSPAARRAAALLLAGVLPLLLCACEKSTESKFPAALDACELLTAGEVEEVVGAAVAEPTRTHEVDEQNGNWISMCNWFAAGADVSAGVMIRPLTVGQESPQSALEVYQDEIKAQYPGYAMEPVEGVGEAAAWNGQMGQLVIFDGPYSYIVNVISRDADTQRKLELAKKLSTAVLAP
jgi:hypothetical protein